jgi:hypothetical protein
MKQKLILICILSFALLNANAQRFGIKAGVALANARYEYTETSISTSNLIGFQAGLIGEIPISDAIYLNSGALFSQKGTKFSILGMEIKFPVNYLEIPLNLAYKYDLGPLKLFAQAGPYLGVGLSAKYTSGSDEEKIDFGSETDQMKRLDYGANFGGGIEIGAVQIGVNYGLGLANISNDPDETMKNGVLSFTVGLLFGK